MINKKRLKKISAAGMTAMFLLSGIPVYAEELPDQDIIIEETETLEQETVAETDETEAPEIDETEAPDTQESESETEEKNNSETDMSETKAPETKVPETEAPETGVPETTKPETKDQEISDESDDVKEEPDWGNIYIIEDGSSFELQERGTGYGVLAFVHSDFAHFSSQFGWRNLFHLEFHSGVDIAAPAGSPILCAGAGKVVVNDYTDARGWEIVIDHGEIDGNRIYTRYQHMIDKSPYEVGTEVKAGQVLGGVGSTGLSTGNHLHFEILKNGLKYLVNEIDPRGEEAEYYYSVLKQAGEENNESFAMLHSHIGDRVNICSILKNKRS